MGAIKQQAIVLMSGGIDSAACAHLLREQGLAVDGVFVDYGQAAANPEARAVAALTEHLGMQWQKICVQGPDPFGSGELVGRNGFLIFAALLFTCGRPGLLALGLHAGTPYYDCSIEFVSAITKLVAEHTNGHVAIVAPFATWTKKDIYDYSISVKLPIQLTYSCETGMEPACGLCASCRDRRGLGC